MEDLSLHVLDIAENSIDAGARAIDILVKEDVGNDLLLLEIRDDGVGIGRENIGRLTDPFYTTRSTRLVGLGLPLLEEAAKAANGSLKVASIPGQGTTVTATFQLSHIDRKPIGQMPDTVMTLVAAQPEIDISYRHECDGRTVSFCSRDFKRRFGNVPVNSPEMLHAIRRHLRTEERRLKHHP